jgi:hypothetical protein
VQTRKQFIAQPPDIFQQGDVVGIWTFALLNWASKRRLSITSLKESLRPLPASLLTPEGVGLILMAISELFIPNLSAAKKHITARAQTAALSLRRLLMSLFSISR